MATDGTIDYAKTALLIQSYVAGTDDATMEVFIENDWSEQEFADIMTRVSEIEAESTIPDVTILELNEIYTTSELEAMTYRRQAFEVALFESTFTGDGGYTNAQFEEYGLYYDLRQKYVDENRLAAEDFKVIYETAVAKTAELTADEKTLSLLVSVDPSMTLDDKMKKGRWALADYLTQFGKQATAELFNFSGL